MSVTLLSPEIELSDDVVQFAETLGVTAYLPRVLEMTRSVFANVPLTLEVDEDPEIADEVCLSIVVQHSIADAHELFLVARGWHQRIFDCCPVQHVAAFRLDTGWHS